ncbi:YcjF family protein [Vibrio sp. SCSIO 43137]|uniref:YcjF family protein n=1 Tax=Vibrio sp. SCSIO 43137 TaxID=3021011 RepID=UPI002307663A|nr:TIGR01620 family protein [Vibrio sp. SCSIO 43137]WCE28329.1 TIGR01620 family protein [Vibrio sp. SCSIO 43137]
MTEIKTKQIFEQPLQKERSDEELTLQQQFEPKQKFVPSEIDETESEQSEQQLESVIRPKKSRGVMVSALLASFTGLVGWQTVDSVITAWQSSDWLTIGWSAFIAAVAGLGISALTRELWKIRKLRNHFSVQEQSESIINSDSIGKGKAFCEDLAAQSRIIAENPYLDRWSNAIDPSHSDAEIIEMYDGMVVSQQDKQAKAIVAKLSTESAALVAISPLAVADILLVAWRNLKMIDKLAEIYGVELGYWSRIQLFKLVLINMAAAGATELATDAGADLLSMDLAGKLSARVAQGFGVGILTARLGLKAMSLLRPVPWNEQSRVKLGEIRKALLLELKNKL